MCTPAVPDAAFSDPTHGGGEAAGARAHDDDIEARDLPSTALKG
jgi:hypothetical protein